MNQNRTLSNAQLSCTVRRPVANDHDRIAVLAKQLGYESTGEEIRGRLREMQDMNQYAVYVAQLPGGQIAGWVGACLVRCVEIGSLAALTGLVVDPQVRNRQIGRALIDAAEAWARSVGCTMISVNLSIMRPRARRFFIKNGYEHIKTHTEFRKLLTS
jgi:GNAT superfamily N-acetyltransferase